MEPNITTIMQHKKQFH